MSTNGIKFYVVRKHHERGAVMGSLWVEKEIAGGGIELVEVCGTVEREADCLPQGKYRVVIGRCKYRIRKMPFLLPLDGDASSEEKAPSHGQRVVDSAQCDQCCKARHCHEFGDTSGFASLPCAMVQPGNGPFTMGKGGILVGDAYEPGYVLDSQSLFTTLHERMKKAIWRGHEVVVEIKHA